MTQQTIEQLENDVWGEPEHPSHVVTECHRLRKKPIDDFTVEELRMMIGQNVGVRYLASKAMTLLRDSPLVSGDLFEGDLLLGVTKCELLQEESQRPMRTEVSAICFRALRELPSVSRDEVFVSHGERPPEELGLSQSDVDAQVQARTQKMRTETPWREFSEFIRANS